MNKLCMVNDFSELKKRFKNTRFKIVVESENYYGVIYENEELPKKPVDGSSGVRFAFKKNEVIVL